MCVRLALNVSKSVIPWNSPIGCLMFLEPGVFHGGPVLSVNYFATQRSDFSSYIYQDLPECHARKSGDEWQLVAKRRQIPSWFTKAKPGRAGFFTSLPHLLQNSDLRRTSLLTRRQVCSIVCKTVLHEVK